MKPASVDGAAMGKAKKKPAAGGAQKALGVEVFKMLDRPPCQIDKVVEVPGSYWEGRMSEGGRSIHYKYIIRDFSAAHRMDGARRVAHAGGRFSCRRWARLGRGASSTATRAAISSRWSIRPLSSASTTRDVLRDVSGGARGGRPQRRRWLERHRPERHRARVIFQPRAQQRPGRSSASSLPQATPTRPMETYLRGHVVTVYYLRFRKD